MVVDLPHLEKPDYAVINLVPEVVEFGVIVKVALVVRKVLEELDVPSCPTTFGATGPHIFIPLAAKYDFDHRKQFAEIIA
jgi:bifunctional non-homologous end joining protein LigD